MRRAVALVAALGLAALIVGTGRVHAAVAAPATPVDAPELARAGPYTVGYAKDVYDPSPGSASEGRRLAVDVWYPAAPPSTGTKVVYAGALTGEDGRDVAFTATGSAFSEARPLAGSFPLVVLAHGYGGTPVAMTWLSEDLASKGYVVVAPRFEDPPITDATQFVRPLARRPLDITFVAREAQRRARDRRGALLGADGDRTVLIGYSMGGYGVLTDAGAGLNPSLAKMTSALTEYVYGGSRAKSLVVANLKAVVAISPAGEFGGASAWTNGGLSAIRAPTLFIVGDADKLVGYDPGVKTLFERETGAARYLLTFDNAGHSIGMNPAPTEMRAKLWDQDWFEDPVWRKDRVTAIQLHFITAFLDLYVKGRSEDRAYLDVPDPISNKGVWPAKAGEAWDRYSPGTPPVTVWKGFQRGHATGLELRFKSPGARP